MCDLDIYTIEICTDVYFLKVLKTWSRQKDICGDGRRLQLAFRQRVFLLQTHQTLQVHVNQCGTAMDDMYGLVQDLPLVRK